MTGAIVEIVEIEAAETTETTGASETTETTGFEETNCQRCGTVDVSRSERAKGERSLRLSISSPPFHPSQEEGTLKYLANEFAEDSRFLGPTHADEDCRCSVMELNAWEAKLRQLLSQNKGREALSLHLPITLQNSINIHKFHVSNILSLAHSRCGVARRVATSLINCLSTGRTKENLPMKDWITTSLVIKEDEILGRIFPNIARTKSLVASYAGRNFKITLKQNLNLGSWTPNVREHWKILRDLNCKEVRGVSRKTRLNNLKKAAVREIRMHLGTGALTPVPRVRWINQKAIGWDNVVSHGRKVLGLSCLHPNMDRTPKELQVAFMNVRSLSKLKAMYLKSSIQPYRPDVLALTEVKDSDALALWSRTHTVVSNVRSTLKGGVAAIISKECSIIRSFTEIEDLIVLTLEKQGAVFVISIVYIHSETNRGDRLSQILEATHAEAFNYVGTGIIICGDFNTPKEETVQQALLHNEHIVSYNNLKLINKYEPPKGFEPLNTRKGINNKGEIVFSRLDYIITNLDALVTLKYQEELSDHCLFTIQSTIRKPKIRRLVTYNRLAITNDVTAMKDLTVQDLCTYVRDQKHKYKVQRDVSKVQLDLSKLELPEDVDRRKEIWIRHFQSFAKNIAELRFSKRQGYAFKVIRQITKYDQYMKRDGSVISVIKTEDGAIINDEKEVHRLLMGVLKSREETLLKTHGSFVVNTPNSLEPLDTEAIKALIGRVSKGKALTDFPVPDEILHKIQTDTFLESLNCLWEVSFLQENPGIFVCKLVPLNKWHPEAPPPTGMRPIVVTICLFKLIELRFNDLLNTNFNLLPNLSMSQTGFIRGMSTQVNIKRLLDFVTGPYYTDPYHPGSPYVRLSQAIPNYPLVSKNMRTYIIFIDYEQAYNSINMARLYQRMRDLTHDGAPMFAKNDLDFIFWIYQQLQIKLGKETFQTKFGVPQGGVNSPILFDWAMYFMMEDLQPVLALYNNLGLMPCANIEATEKNSYHFADDAAYAFHLDGDISEHKETLKKFLWMLDAVSTEWGLKINWKKSAIMCPLAITGSPSQLSDQKTKYEGLGIERQAPLTLKLDRKIHYGLTDDKTIQIPLVKSYKYLGVNIHWNLSFAFHHSKLKQKITYITNCFVAIRKASESPRFCHNTWTTFIRPLLDYSALYTYYTGEKGRNLLEVLYRTSLKAMMFIKNYAPNELVDKLVQYDYRHIWEKMHELVRNKIQYRADRVEDVALLNEKLDYGYDRIDLSMMSPQLVTLMNTFYCRGDCKRECEKRNGKAHGPDHWQGHMNEDRKDLGVVHEFIRNYMNNIDNLKFDHVSAEKAMHTTTTYLTGLIAVKGGRSPHS